MSDAPLHIVLGVGQVGRAVAERLAGSGAEVRAISRHRPAGLSEKVDWRTADLTDPEAAIDTLKGAAVVYQCLNVAYTRWPELFPPLQHNVLAAVERAEALLITLENVYAYGPTAGRLLTEDLPLAAATSKGHARAAMTAELLSAAATGRARIAIGRASDFFGPGVTQSALGSRVFGNAVAGKRAEVMGDPDLLHSYSYVPDIAAGLITLGADERALGQVWHLPGPQTVTTRSLLGLVAEDLGHGVGLRALPKPILRALALVSPLMRGLAEMAYQFEQPFVLDTSKYTATFGADPTPLATAVRDTVAWYLARDGSGA